MNSKNAYASASVVSGRTISLFQKKTLDYALGTNDPLLLAMAGVGAESSSEGALAEALLRSFERYQGADQKGNGTWALVHARAIRDNSLQLRAQLAKSSDALKDLDDALAADTTPLDANAASVQEFITRVRASGFTDDEVREALNLGLTYAEIGELDSDVAAMDLSTFSKANLRGAIADLRANNDSLVTELNTLATDMQSNIMTLEADPLVSNKAPKASAGGPYGGAEGTSISFDASSSISPSSITNYEWDLDGDGAFDDAMGATPTRTYNEAFEGLVGVRVTNSDNFRNVAYTRLDVADVNRRPKIDSASPEARIVTLDAGTTMTFSVTASDPDGDSVSVEWFVDGTSAGTGAAFAYKPTSTDIGLHSVEARVGDDSPLGGDVRRKWSVAVLVPDSDADGYRANADCDDSDASVNPGQTEILGNNKDDDCNTATPDTGAPPTAKFVLNPATGIVGEPVQLTDRSTDPDSQIASWAWEFGDGGTSMAQTPVHTYTAAGSYTVKLTVIDEHGNKNSATKTLKVTSAPTADFAVSPAKPVVNKAAQLADTSTDADGTIAAWKWDFGDGTSSTVQNPSHIYQQTGSYTVKLTVTDNDGATASVTRTVTVIAPPKAFFNPEPALAHSIQGRNVALLEGGASIHSYSSQYSTSYPAQTLIDYPTTNSYWATASGQLSNQWVKISLAGGKTYLIDRVRLMPAFHSTERVSDFAIAVSTTTTDESAFTTVLTATAVNNNLLQEFVLNKPVLAKYVLYRPLKNRGNTCCLATQQLKVFTGQEGGRTVSFEDLSTDPDKDIVSWHWNFGDGTTSTEASPTHTFPEGSATYNVTLTTTDAEGLTDSYSLTQRVLTPPSAGFTFSPAAPNEGHVVTFTDTSTDPDGGSMLMTRTWNWGDGSRPINTTVTSAAHAFPDSSTYTVTLAAVDAQEQVGEVQRTVTTANVPPTAVLDAPKLTSVDGTFTLSLLAAYDVSSADRSAGFTYAFDCGGGYGTPSSSKTTICPATGAPTYTVRGKVSDKDGASREYTATVTTGAIELTPQISTVTASGSATLTAKATDVAGKALGGVPLQMSVTGANKTTVRATTNSLGLASFTYQAILSGDDSAVVQEDGSSISSNVASVHWPTDADILILSTTVVSGLNSGEARVARSQGLTVAVLSPTAWQAKTTADFARAKAIVLGDNGGCGDLSPASANKTVWGPAITGNVIILGTDPQDHGVDGTNLRQRGIAFASDELGKTGAYIALSECYDGRAANTPVPLLDPFGAGAFAVRGAGCSGGAHIVATHPTLTGLQDSDISGSCVHEAFDKWHPDFLVLAIDLRTGAAYTANDGTVGNPYILARGKLLTVISDIKLSPATATSEVGADHTITATVAENEVLTSERTVTFTVVSGPHAGTTSTATTGTDGTAKFVYKGTAIGTDSVEAKFVDSEGKTQTSNRATVEWEVPKNQPPVAEDQTVTIDEDKAADITLTATDPDGDPLTFSIATQPTHDKLSGTAPNLQYTPDSGYSGADSFTYKANDGKADSAVATVSITVKPVNDKPEAGDDSAKTPEDEALTVGQAVLLANDTDIDNSGAELSVTAVSNATHGAVELLDGGAVRFTPAADYNGPAGFDYTLSDGGLTDTAHVTVSVTLVNDPPKAVADNKATAEDEALTFPASDLTANDSAGPSDESGQHLAVTAVTTTDGTNGTVEFAGGEVTYKPRADFNGEASFAYKVCDDGETDGTADHKCNTGTVNVTVRPINDKPSAAASPTSLDIDEDAAPQTVELSGSDVETAGADLRSTVTAGLAHGTLKLKATGARLSSGETFTGSPADITYQPDADYNGPDSFKFKVTDTGDGGSAALDSDIVIVDVTVKAVNDAPVATPSSTGQEVQYSDPIETVTISGTDIDSPMSSLTASTIWKEHGDATWRTTQPLGGLSLTPTGDTADSPRTWTLEGRSLVEEGTYTVRVAVSDGQDSGYTDVTIEVTLEDARIEYSGDTLKSTGSASSSSTTSLDLAAVVREAVDGSIGDKLNTTQVRFTLYKFTDTTMTSPVDSCSAAVALTGSGTGTAGCAVSSVAADNYTVKVELLENGYYTSPVENQAVTVTLVGTGFTTGGGWVNLEGGTRSNFGFTVKYLKNGNIQGNSLYIYRVRVDLSTLSSPPTGAPTGMREYNWIIKSNAMSGLTQSCTTTTPEVCKATFTGKNTIAAVDRLTGVAYSLGGNYQFQVDVADKGEPGSSSSMMPDTYAIRVWSGTNGTYYQLGKADAQVEINGGNIQVRP